MFLFATFTTIGECMMNDDDFMWYVKALKVIAVKEMVQGCPTFVVLRGSC